MFKGTQACLGLSASHVTPKEEVLLTEQRHLTISRGYLCT